MSIRLTRPPATPLITIDPYTSVWSAADALTGAKPTHWSGVPHELHGLIRVDGEVFRFLSSEEWCRQVAVQTDLTVTPTRSIYQFRSGPVGLRVTFTSPLLLDDLDLLSRPVNYVNFDVWSLDGEEHATEIYFDVCGMLAVNWFGDPVDWEDETDGDVRILSLKAHHQKVLENAGDDLRIEWGRAFLAVPDTAATFIGDINVARDAFMHATRPALNGRAVKMPRGAGTAFAPVASCVQKIACPAEGEASAFVLVGYDDEYALEYFQTRLRAWWRRDGKADHRSAIREALADKAATSARCIAFDDDMRRDAVATSGEAYADLLAIAYRQAVAAHKLVAGPDGKPIFLSKENFSNGSIGTVDVTYPSAPLFLKYNPELLRAMIRPIFDYCRMPAWKFDFPAHDLGTYPKANGQTYGRYNPDDPDASMSMQMPVEEAGNMLILSAALAKVEGHAEFALGEWDLLTTWAEYLLDHGVDPVNQLSTDDFLGPNAHNANLSAKALVAVASYVQLARKLDKPVDRFEAAVTRFRDEWLRRACGPHGSFLTLDAGEGWSLKYNLVWDRILDLGLIPDDVREREARALESRLQPYGLALDHRAHLGKPEWMMWAALTDRSNGLFDQVVQRVLAYVNDTPNRVPLGDAYFVDSSRHWWMQARSVVGGFWIALLLD